MEGGNLFAKADLFLDKILKWVDETPKSRILLTLLMVNFLAVMPIIAGYIISPNPDHESNTDLDIFRDRAGTILDGDLLYRDTDNVTLTPPVINYLLTPPMILGDDIIVWQLWFTGFTFLTSGLMFLMISSLANNRVGFTAALFYQSSPFAVYTTAAMVQDDTIIPLFLLFIMAMIIKKLWYKAALFAGIGTMTKLFPALVAPLIFFDSNDWKTRFRIVGLGIGSAFLICLPFLIFAGDEFIPFLEFYLLGKEPVGITGLEEDIAIARGMSMWAFLARVNLVVPTGLLHGLFILSIIGIWTMVGKGNLDSIRGFSLCILAIFILYSKLHYGYHLMLLVALIPWSMHDYRRILGLFMAALVARIVHLEWRDYLNLPGGELIPLLLAIGLWLYWIWWARVLINGPSFSEQWSEEASAKGMKVVLVSSALFFCLIFVVRLIIQI
jgi:hypothetical protein